QQQQWRAPPRQQGQYGHAISYGSAAQSSFGALISAIELPRRRLFTVAGIADRVSAAIISEIGVDMSWFPPGAHVALLDRVVPGQPRVRRQTTGKTREGNPYLKYQIAIKKAIVAIAVGVRSWPMTGHPRLRSPGTHGDGSRDTGHREHEERPATIRRMALLHRAELHPTKRELLAAWLPGRRWYQG